MQVRDDGAATAPSRVEHGSRLAIISAGIILATLLEMVDTTIVNVALPDIQGNLGATIDQGTYVVTGYVVANVVVVPLTPWLQARFGLKRYYLASIVLFMAASLLCGFSGSFDQLVVWRIVQGIGGGGLISTSQTILRDIFPPDRQGAAQGIFAGGVIIGPTLGPLIGGFITDNVDWRWCFFVNAPLAIVAVFLIGTFMREPEKPRRIAIDGVGVALLATGLGSLQFVLDQGERNDWFDDGSIRAFTALAAIGLAAFVAWGLRARNPIVDLRVLRHPGVWAGSLLGGALGLALFGSLVILPQYVQSRLNFTAFLSGQLLSVRAVAMAVLLPVGARLATSGRVDPRLQIGIGMVLLGYSSFLLAAATTTQTPFSALVPSLVIAGVGLSQVFVPLQLSVFAGLSQGDVPKAAAFFNLARQLGGSIATAALVTILDRTTAMHSDALASAMTLSAPAVAGFVRSHADRPDTIAQLAQLVAAQASVLGYADVARLSGAITFALTPFALVLRRSTAPPDSATIGE